METIEKNSNQEVDNEALFSRKQMNRRTFIKKSVVAGLTGLAATAGVQEVLAGESGKVDRNKSSNEQKCNYNGKYPEDSG